MQVLSTPLANHVPIRFEHHRADTPGVQGKSGNLLSSADPSPALAVLG